MFFKGLLATRYEGVERAFALKKLLEEQHSLLTSSPVAQIMQVIKQETGR